MTRKHMPLEKQRTLMSLSFIAPWLIGFILLFALPLFQSFRYSLSDLEITASGFTLKPVGMDNYNTLLTVNPDFNRNLTEAVLYMVVNVPLIVIFSLIVATLLNQKFVGRGFFRSVFFLPVILTSGVLVLIDSSDFLQQMMRTATAASGSEVAVLKSFELRRLLVDSGMNRVLAGYLLDAVDRIYEIISSSGVQILIFLAGLQSISPPLYEAAKIEGATGYESFWKITFPMVSPLILTNVIYSIIDSFTTNKMTTMIQTTAFSQFDFGLSAAMSWLYFLVIVVVLVIVGALVSKKVFYYD